MSVLEPVGAAILLLEERLSVVKLALGAATALGGVGAIEEGNMLVADISEPVHKGLANRHATSLLQRYYVPVDFALVLKQAQRDTMDGRIAPSFVEKAASSVKMVEVVLVHLAPPERHVGNLEVGPEMAGGITVGLFPMIGAACLVC